MQIYHNFLSWVAHKIITIKNNCILQGYMNKVMVNQDYEQITTASTQSNTGGRAYENIL